MELEKLSKSQIVLLTLLTSFVTSVATGIVTVALIEEAPTDVTRVVQRVVEHTVETIEPSEQQATVVTQEKTVVVKESDLIAESVAKNTARVLPVYNIEGAFVSLGTLVTKGGYIVVDAAQVAQGETYTLGVGEAAVPLSVKALNTAYGVAILLPVDAVIETAPVVKGALPALGQTVFIFVGEEALGVAQGIIARTATEGVVYTDIAKGSLTTGAPLFTVGGAFVGVFTGESAKVHESAFVSAAVIEAVADAAVENAEPAE